MKLINLEQGGELWLASRKETFNASECGMLFQCSPFGVKQAEQQDQLSRQKYQGEETHMNQYMQEGIEAEPIIREYVESILGETLEPMVGCMDTDERFRASFDGVSMDGKTILECKYSTNTYDKVEKKGVPPKHYYLQIQHQLMVSEAERCVFAVMHKVTKQVSITNVYPNLTIMEEIKQKWIEFEQKYRNESA